jgi:gas vesicle protein
MDAKNLIGGMLIGATLGVTLGVLYAPTSGKQTRKNIASKSNELMKDVKKQIKSSVDTIRSQYNNGVDKTAKRSKQAIGNLSEHAKI